MAKLQTELSAARLQEFEAQEQLTLLNSQLDEERQARRNSMILLFYIYNIINFFFLL